MFISYILYSAKLDKYYIGFTGDNIHVRIYKHLASHKGFTAKAKDWQLAYSETFNTKQEAMKREREIKAWKSRIMIEQLISRRSSTE